MDESVVGAGIAEDPAAAMDVEDRRERSLCTDGLDDPDLHGTDWCGDLDPLVVDVGLVDGL